MSMRLTEPDQDYWLVQLGEEQAVYSRNIKGVAAFVEAARERLSYLFDSVKVVSSLEGVVGFAVPGEASAEAVASAKAVLDGIEHGWDAALEFAGAAQQAEG